MNKTQPDKVPTVKAEDRPVSMKPVRDDMQGAWAKSVQTDIARINGSSSKVILGCAAVFALWAGTFPLAQAVVAEGTIISKGQNKVLQHRGGGTVSAIMAREGDTVAADAIVMRLDPAQDQAELTRLRARLAVLDAMHQRLSAEKTFATSGMATLPSGFSLRGLRDVVAPAPRSDDALITNAAGGKADDRMLKEVTRSLLMEQQREFEKGRGMILAEIDALISRMDALKKRRTGVVERITTVTQQVALLQTQLDAMRPVVQRGHIARKTLWDLEEAALARRGELANVRAEDGALANEIAETSAKIIQARMNDERQTSTRLTEVIAEMAQIRDQLRAAERNVDQTDVRASVEGTLIHVKHTTIGAVAAPGEVLAQIVPKGAELAFRVRVAPNDITHVKVGQSARAKITALNAREHDDVPGIVTFVASDSTLDEKTGARYFDAEFSLSRHPRDARGRPLLTQGMMGVGYIDGEKRTLANYLFKPILDSFPRSFQER